MLYSVSMTNTDHTIIIDTPEGIQFFQLLAVEGVLKLDVNHGMKSRVNGRQWVNHKFGTDFKASAKGKREALAFVRERILDAKVEKEISVIESTGLYEIQDETALRAEIRAYYVAESAEADAR